jgi:two-component system NarL family response regulator
MKKVSPIRVMVVDDHPVVREGLAATINYQADMKVVAQAASGSEALECYHSTTPDVTLMDLEMPGMDSVTTITAIRAEFPAACILLLSTYGADDDVYKATCAGAVGCLLKDAPIEDVLQAIRSFHAAANPAHQVPHTGRRTR